MIEEIVWEYPLQNLDSIIYTAEDKQILRELGYNLKSLQSYNEEFENPFKTLKYM